MAKQASPARQAQRSRQRTQAKAREAAKRETSVVKDTENKKITVTCRGITVDLTQDLFNDFEVLDALNSDNPFPLIHAIWPDPAVRAAALEPLRGEDGKITMEAVIAWLGGVIEAVDGGKSSGSSD